jgi:hypothetical protein
MTGRRYPRCRRQRLLQQRSLGSVRRPDRLPEVESLASSLLEKLGARPNRAASPPGGDPSFAGKLFSRQAPGPALATPWESMPGGWAGCYGRGLRAFLGDRRPFIGTTVGLGPAPS